MTVYISPFHIPGADHHFMCVRSGVIIAVGFGEPWISGNVNLLQGKVDLKFRIEGSKGELSPLRRLPLQYPA